MFLLIRKSLQPRRMTPSKLDAGAGDERFPWGSGDDVVTDAGSFGSLTAAGLRANAGGRSGWQRGESSHRSPHCSKSHAARPRQLRRRPAQPPRVCRLHACPVKVLRASAALAHEPRDRRRSGAGRHNVAASVPAHQSRTGACGKSAERNHCPGWARQGATTPCQRSPTTATALPLLRLRQTVAELPAGLGSIQPPVLAAVDQPAGRHR